MDDATTLKQALRGFGAWIGFGKGMITLLVNAGLVVAVTAFVFWTRLARLQNLSGPSAGDSADAAKPDPVARRRLTAITLALDRVGGGQRRVAKQALMQGELRVAKNVFMGCRQDNPSESLRGQALVAEHQGDVDTARARYDEMHARDLQHSGVNHPQTRQGALLYAAFLRATAPGDPKLGKLKAKYGQNIGR